MKARNAGEVGRNRWSVVRSASALITPASHRQNAAMDLPERFGEHAAYCDLAGRLRGAAG